MTTTSRRLLPLVSLFLLQTGVASAQTTGTISGVVTDASSGKPIAGALVVATSPFLQGPQTGLTDKTGAFRITLLPPGGYRVAVQLDGYLPAERSDLTLRLDMTLRANLVLVPEVVRMEEQVVKSGQKPVVDVGSAETGTTISRDFLDDIPVGRGFQDVAVVAPTARLDRFGVAFAGASSPENGYLLDGLSVNDPSSGTLGLELRSNFVQEIEVKTGNFMPEYGFSTGGILNVVTRSGSNEFHGSVFGTWTPGFLRPEPKPVGRDAEALSLQAVQADSYQADVGFEVGGPILKDRLWFYVGFSPGFERTRYQRVLTAIQEDPANPGFPLRDAHGLAVGAEQPAYSRELDAHSTEYQLTSKLTYLFNENNTLAVSFTTTPRTSEAPWSANREPGAMLWKAASGSTQAVARYSSKLLEKRLTVELLGGWLRSQSQLKPSVVDGIDQANFSQVWWNWTEPLATFQGVPAACQANSASGFEPCPVTGYLTGGYGGLGSSTTDRFTGKASVSWLARLLGSHLLKAGAEFDRTRSRQVYEYSGGQLIEARAAVSPNPNYRRAGTFPDALANPFVGAAGYLPGLGYPASYGVWYRSYQYGHTTGPDENHAFGTGASIQSTMGATSVANTLGLYLQDGYSPTDRLTINAGLRWEAQDMGPEGQPANLSINDNFGPRVQAIYDWTRQGRSKVSVSWGRFYEAIPLIISDLAFANVSGVQSFHAYCYDPRTDPAHANLYSGPAGCAIRPGYYDPSGNTTPGTSYTYKGGTGASTTPVAPDLKGQYVDMFSATVEYELLPDLSVGFEYQGRRLGRIIEDMSVDEGNSYFIANPGTGAPFQDPGTGKMVDPRMVTGVVDPVTGRIYDVAFPKPKRDYDAVTFSVRKSFSNRWQLQGSYTWSSLRGNHGGLVGGVNEGQLMPNLTTDFDLPSLLTNSTGPLPGDSTHQLKAYGSYTFDFGPRFSVTPGGGVRGWSGTPVNYMGAHPNYGSGSAFILPRGSAGRTPFLTQVDLGVRLHYVMVPPYAVRFSIDAFNLLNARQATRVDQSWTYDTVQPAIGGQCHAHNGASGSDPIGKALADCPDLAYLRTLAGRPVTINQNFGRATAYQQPLAVRLGLELTF